MASLYCPTLAQASANTSASALPGPPRQGQGLIERQDRWPCALFLRALRRLDQIVGHALTLTAPGAALRGPRQPWSSCSSGAVKPTQLIRLPRTRSVMCCSRSQKCPAGWCWAAQCWAARCLALRALALCLQARCLALRARGAVPSGAVPGAVPGTSEVGTPPGAVPGTPGACAVPSGASGAAPGTPVVDTPVAGVVAGVPGTSGAGAPGGVPGTSGAGAPSDVPPSDVPGASEGNRFLRWHRALRADRSASLGPSWRWRVRR